MYPPGGQNMKQFSNQDNDYQFFPGYNGSDGNNRMIPRQPQFQQGTNNPNFGQQFDLASKCNINSANIQNPQNLMGGCAMIGNRFGGQQPPYGLIPGNPINNKCVPQAVPMNFNNIQQGSPISPMIGRNNGQNPNQFQLNPPPITNQKNCQINNNMNLQNDNLMYKRLLLANQDVRGENINERPQIRVKAKPPQPQIINEISVTKENFTEKIAELREVELAHHNKYRYFHGAAALKLNSEINEISQKYAEQLLKEKKFQYSQSYYNGKPLGENIYMFSSLQAENKYSGGSATSEWYNWNNGYDYEKGEAKNKVRERLIEQFTQVVWKESKEIGIGIAMDEENCYVVANYYPAGNTLGDFTTNVAMKE